MTSPRDFVRSSFSLPLSRAGLPVVSNRAFIQAWAARRRLGAIQPRRDVAAPGLRAVAPAVPRAALPLAS